MDMDHDHITITIDNKLSNLHETHQKPFIFKVFKRYRNQNKRAYKPEMLAIGPYNHHKAILLHTIQDHKLRYLHSLLTRRGEFTAERYVKAVVHVEERARRCYATDFMLEPDRFVELLIIDGMFIVELCRKFSNRKLVHEHDMIFKVDWIHHVLWRDMMLFENQIPFFVVNMLFEMTRSFDESGRDGMVDLLLKYYFSTRKYYHYHSRDSSGYNAMDASKDVAPHDVKHILGLIHRLTTRSLAEKMRNDVGDDKTRWEFIDNATELHEAGIKLRTKHDCPLFNVTFKKGTLEIPLIIIEEKTEGFLRNLIAYEQCLDENSPRIVTDFTTLLYCLIKSSSDVGLLRKYGILNNLIGDDKSASRVISRLSSSVFVSHDRFCYKDVFNRVNAYYRKPRHTWAANLWRNYLNTPWAVISFLAASMLLVLSFGQTLAAVAPFFITNSHSS